jgi:chromosome segregation ATPase
MISQRTWNAHPHLAWAMWGLDEIEATLASIESRLHDRANVHPKAESAMVDMRTARDTFRRSIEEQLDQAYIARSKTGLEGQWAAFEDSVQNYLDRVDRQVTRQETIFRARADAQRRAWLQAIDNLHESAARLAADRRSDIETAVKHLESEADAAKVKLDQLNKAEGASWAAMRLALAETRAALDRAHRSVVDALERPT